jgi:PAS domain S-box-containing protein
MSEPRDEEEELRSVTLQNARTIFIARQRAEAELGQTREALRKQSKWLQVTLASIGDAVVTTDMAGKVLYMNAVAEQLTGWTQEEAKNRPLRDVFRIIDEEKREPVPDPVERALRENQSVGLSNHTILITRDGSELPIDDSASPIRDEQGRIYGVVLVFRSIAERRRSEQALQRSERQLADFFENAAIGIHWLGPDGLILRVNRAQLELLGYDRAEYLGHHVGEFHADADVAAEFLQRLATGEAVHNFEARVRCRDGSIRHVLIDCTTIEEAGHRIHTCFTRDITDRRQIEEMRSRLAAIVESSQDAIVSKTLEGVILSWNAGAETLFGYRAGEMIGRPVTTLIPDDRQDEERIILGRLRRGERIEHYETVRVTKQGRRIHVSLSISPVRDGTGRIIGASKIARDIAARKRAEQRLAMQNDVSRTLASSLSIGDAAQALLRAICDNLEWDAGLLWSIDTVESVLRCVDVYEGPGVAIPRFAAASRALTFGRGEGLPGRVWTSGRAEFIADITGDAGFSRASVAADEDLHGAFGFPILRGDEVVGVLEFYRRAVWQPDDELLRIMPSVGSQIGEFIGHRRVEAAMRESEQRFRIMASAIPSMIWTASPDGTITYANERWYAYCGLTPEENASDWLNRVVHPDDRDRCKVEWSAAIERGMAYEIEVRNRRHDGVYRWFITRAVPFLDEAGRVTQWFGTTTDIDDRKRAERISTFLAGASAALARLTDVESTLQKVAALAVPNFADWCIVHVQDGPGELRRLTITHTDPARAKLALELDRRYPVRPDARHGVAAVIRTGETEWAATLPAEQLATIAEDDEHLRLLQELRPASYICVPLRSRTTVLGALTFVTSAAGRVYGTEEVRAAEDLANRAVVAIENAALLASLQESHQRKDEFLAMLAHELRNPLAPIRNAADVWRAARPRTPELQLATEVIDRQVQQMTRLVDDLLDVSRITRGKIKLRTEVVALAAVIDTAVEASRPLMEKWEHELVVDVPAEPIHLRADAPRLAQVLVNLLNNAAKYTERGGRIELRVQREDTQVTIRVRDNGIGIPADALQRVFEMFTQVDRSLERAEGGLGLGLTVVQRLVEMHGGTIEAHSEGSGRGSEFVVRLPLVDAPASAAPAVAPASVQPQAGQQAAWRILIVDDNHDAAETLAILMRALGNEVQTAHDGLEAVAAAETFRPEIILLDIGLPKLSGYDAARRIRQLEHGADMLLVALTGWGQVEDRRRSKEAGFDHHMTKPIEFKVLRELLAENAHRKQHDAR